MERLVIIIGEELEEELNELKERIAERKIKTRQW